MRSHSNWQWLLDKAFVNFDGDLHCVWRAADHEGEVLESYIVKRRDSKAALTFLKKTKKYLGNPHVVVTALLRPCGLAATR